MFRSQSIKHTITAGAVALAFVFSSSAMAGKPEGKVVPGKPGPDNIVEIAMAVNGLLGEFDYLLGAVGCLTDADARGDHDGARRRTLAEGQDGSGLEREHAHPQLTSLHALDLRAKVNRRE